MDQVRHDRSRPSRAGRAAMIVAALASLLVVVPEAPPALSEESPLLIDTIAGGFNGDGELATNVDLKSLHDVTIDADGNLYVADVEARVVRRIDGSNTNASGTISTLAGTGIAGNSGDGGPAVEAKLTGPFGVAIDGNGNVYIADPSAHRIRRVDPSGTITTVAGTGVLGYSGDGGPAASAQLSSPWGVAVDGSGNVYIADTMNRRLRRVSPSGTITTVAGTGVAGYGGDEGPATGAQLQVPRDVAVAPDGRIFVADGDKVRMINQSGNIETVAGTGVAGYSGDGGPATSARLNSVQGLAVTSAGTIYMADGNNHRLRKVVSTGTITTVAGTGAFNDSGDGGPAASAAVGSPRGVTVGSDGSVYFADNFRGRVRKINPSGTISTLAGAAATAPFGDGGPALRAQLNRPRTAAVDSVGNVYIADHLDHRVRRVDESGAITTVAGTGVAGHGGDGGPATSAQLNYPGGVAVDGADNLYIATSASLRKVDPSGAITTVATGTSDGAIAVDANGNVYLAENTVHRIRKIDAAGVATVVAGTGTGGYSGDGGPATSAQLNNPSGLALDAGGNLYVADTWNHRVRRVDPAGTITTVAGGGVSGSLGDGGPASEASLFWPYGVGVGTGGDLYIADTFNARIRKVDASGTISTVAGTGVEGRAGDQGPATSAELYRPHAVAVDDTGSLYVTDRDDDRIRIVWAPGEPGAEQEPLVPSLDACREAECPYDDATELPPTDQVHTTALQTFGAERFAGLWIDRMVSPSMLRVGVVAASAQDEATLDQITGIPERTDAVDMTYSLAQLEGFQATIEEILLEAGGSWGLGPDEVLNRVEIEAVVVPPTLALEIVQAGVPADAFVIVPGFSPPQPAHGQRNAYPPYEGGLEVLVRHGEGDWRPCTSWFTVSDGNDAKGVTAGHCEPANENGRVRMGGRALGDTGPNSYWPNRRGVDSDALRFNIPDDNSTNRIMVGPGSHNRVIGPTWGTGGPARGVTVCFQGITTARRGDPNCGVVERVNREFISGDPDDPDDDVLHRHMWRASVDVDRGDSGGPVYTVEANNRARPAGMVTLWTDQGDFWFHHVVWTVDEIVPNGGIIG